MKLTQNTHVEWKGKIHRTVEQIPKKWKKPQIMIDKVNAHQINIRNPNNQKAHASEKGKRFIVRIVLFNSCVYEITTLTCKHSSHTIWVIHCLFEWSQFVFSIIEFKVNDLEINIVCIRKQTAFIVRRRERLEYINRRKIKAECQTKQVNTRKCEKYSQG